MLTCKDVCENASDYLDGSPGMGERLQWRLHLLICKHCRRFLRQFRLSSDVAANLSEIQAPSDEEIDALVKKLSESAS